MSPVHFIRTPRCRPGLALKSKLLILDEPTAALDVSVQAKVLQLPKALQTDKRSVPEHPRRA